VWTFFPFKRLHIYNHVYIATNFFVSVENDLPRDATSFARVYRRPFSRQTWRKVCSFCLDRIHFVLLLFSLFSMVTWFSACFLQLLFYFFVPF
jgi:hypothetical protein